jgi:membrane protein DedA with SNARE-associated domain
VLLMLGIVGLPIPDETLLIFCGYLISKGRLSLLATLAAAFSGSACGISLSYVVGRAYGNTIIHRYGTYIGLTLERLQRVHGWFDRIGAWLLAIGYFIPGVRHFTAIVAGTSGMRFPLFALFAYLGAAAWVAVFLALGYTVGERWQQTSDIAHKYILEATGAAAVLLALAWGVRSLHRARKTK